MGAGGKQKYRILEHISVTKLNYRLYTMVLLVAVAILYLIVARYLMDGLGSYTDDGLTINVVRNSAERFSDGPHPLVVITVSTETEAVIDIEFISDTYTTRYSSGGYTTNYTANAILPSDTFSTEFDINVDSSYRAGDSTARRFSLITEKKPKVTFSIE